MKIQPVIFDSFNNHKTKNVKNNFISFGLKSDVFEVQKAKKSPIDRFLEFFALNKTENPDKIINRKINDNVKDVLKASKVYKNVYAKKQYSLAKTAITIARQNHFQTYTHFNSDNDQRLIFFNINKELQMPEIMSVIAMKEAMATKRSYNFYHGFACWAVKDYTQQNITTDMLLNRGNLTAVKITNLNNKNAQKYIYTTEGLYFYDADTDAKGNIIKPKVILNYNSKNPEKNEYISLNSEGLFEIYSINPKTNNWELREMINNIDLEEID